MADNPLTMARRHILGDLNHRCERVRKVPVYLDNTAGEVLGFVIESSNEFADALTFHLADDVCKKVAAGHYGYSCDYDYADGTDTVGPHSPRRVELSSITLLVRKAYEKPIPRRRVSEPLVPDSVATLLEA